MQPLAGAPEAQARRQAGRRVVLRSDREHEPPHAVLRVRPAHQPAARLRGVAAPAVGGEDRVAELDAVGRVVAQPGAAGWPAESCDADRAALPLEDDRAREPGLEPRLLLELREAHAEHLRHPEPVRGQPRAELLLRRGKVPRERRPQEPAPEGGQADPRGLDGGPHPRSLEPISWPRSRRGPAPVARHAPSPRAPRCEGSPCRRGWLRFSRLDLGASSRPGSVRGSREGCLPAQAGTRAHRPPPRSARAGVPDPDLDLDLDLDT